MDVRVGLAPQQCPCGDGPSAPATSATPTTATMTWTSSSSQSMPLVTVGMPSARASAVPMNAETMPTRIVSEHPDGLLAGQHQSAEHADDCADQDCGDDAGESHVEITSIGASRCVELVEIPAADRNKRRRELRTGVRRKSREREHRAARRRHLAPAHGRPDRRGTGILRARAATGCATCSSRTRRPAWRSSRPVRAPTTTWWTPSSDCCRATTATGTRTVRPATAPTTCCPAIVSPSVTVPVQAGRTAAGHLAERRAGRPQRGQSAPFGAR